MSSQPPILLREAKHILTDDRKRMESRRLEEVLYLLYNRTLWDERTVRDALTRAEREDAATSATSGTSATTTRSASIAS